MGWLNGSFASQTCHVEQVHGACIDSVVIVEQRCTLCADVVATLYISNNTLPNIEFCPYGLPNALIFINIFCAYI